MKKFISFITAAAAVLAAMPMAANDDEAADERTYSPTVYFTSEAKTPAISLASGLLYVNTSAADADVVLPSQIAIKDQYKHVGQFTIKWTWDTDYVYTSGIRNPSADGKSAAYKGYDIYTDEKTGDKVDPVMYYVEDGEKMMGIDYSNSHINPLEPSGAESDTNPVGLFDLNIAKNSPADYYSINFKTEQPYVTNIILRYAEDQSFRSIRPNGENAPSLKIAVTDRALGEVNGDGALDGRDATDILSDYALRSAGKESIFNKAQMISADVDGNQVVDANDATNVLSYYAYASSSKFDGTSLNDFVIKNQ